MPPSPLLVVGKFSSLASSLARSNRKMTNAKKTKKPLIEKQRRERMNKSLVQIKQLVLQATNKNEMNYMKMEKADILEMTVTFLKNLQKSQSSFIHPVSPNAATTAASAAGHKNFLQTFQEPTSTTLLSEDSPAREATMASGRPAHPYQSGNRSPSSSSFSSSSSANSPLPTRSDQTRLCDSDTNSRLCRGRACAQKLDHHSSKALEEFTPPSRKESCWRPWW